MSNSQTIANLSATPSTDFEPSVQAAFKKDIANTTKRISTSEAKTKGDIKHVVNLLLAYVPRTGDIATLNRLLLVVNAPTRKLLIDFMKKHIGHKYDDKQGMFTNKLKGKALTKCIANSKKFGEGDIWAWKKETSPPPATDWKARTASALKSAADPEKGNMTAHDLAEVINASEFSLVEIMAEIEAIKDEVL